MNAQLVRQEQYKLSEQKRTPFVLIFEYLSHNNHKIRETLHNSIRTELSDQLRFPSPISRCIPGALFNAFSAFVFRVLTIRVIRVRQRERERDIGE